MARFGEVGFAFCHLLGFQLLPRLKQTPPHILYVYASLSRLDFRGLADKSILVSERVTGFSTVKKANRLNDALV